MDYEKKYKEALERARQFSEHPLQEDSDNIVEYIFPELKEFKEEKIRKALMRFVESFPYECLETDGVSVKKALAWLEKQGEKEPSDKVESKFHEGDWVILTAGELSTTLQIVKIDTNKKLYWFNDNSYLPIVDEECLHHWTIQDAKDGDVLSDGTTIFIFKDLLSDGSVMSYCDYDTDSGESDDFCPLLTNLMCSKITPATKEQRDTLMKAMTDVGYTFNFEKKELKKIEEPELTEFEDAVKDMMDDYRDAIDTNVATTEEVKERAAYMLSLIPHKSAWSEEDECYMAECINAIATKDGWSFEEKRKTKHWLESLKQRIGG